MLIEEVLLICGLLKNYTKSCSREQNVILIHIFQITSGIETAETMGVFKFQVTVRFSSHLRGGFLVNVWGRGINLTLES
jgi:hypothetical protein